MNQTVTAAAANHIALIGNFLPFAFVFRGENDWAGSVPAAIQVATISAGIWTLLSLRRSMGITPANRGIKTGGPYRFIRHPLYTFVIVSQAGLWLEYPSVFNAVVLFTAIVFKSVMIINEERVLREDPAYVEYSRRVRHRAIPGVL